MSSHEPIDEHKRLIELYEISEKEFIEDLKVIPSGTSQEHYGNIRRPANTTLDNGGGTGGTTGGTTTTIISENSKIKNYGTVSGVVTINQTFKSHVMTLIGDVTIQFDNNINAQNLKELFFDIEQKAGKSYAVTWPSSVTTKDSISIKNNASLDVSNYLVGFSNDQGTTYQISNVGAKRVVIQGDLNSEINYWLSQTDQAGIKWANDLTTVSRDNIDAAAAWVNNAISEMDDWWSSSTMESKLDTAYDWINDAGNKITEQINLWLSQISQAGIKWANDLTTVSRDNIDAAGVWINSASTNVKNIIDDSIENIETALGDTYQSIKTAVSGITVPLSTWLSQQSVIIRALIDSALQSGTELFNSVVNAVSTQVSDIVELISGSAGEVVDALKSNLDSAYVQTANFFSGVKTGIDDWINEASQDGLRWANGLSTSIQNSMESVSEWFDGLSLTIRNGIGGAVDWVQEASQNIKDVISSAVNEVGNALGDVWDWLKNLTQPSQTMINEGKLWADFWATYPASQSVNMGNNAITGIHFLRLTNIGADSISNGDIWLNGSDVKLRSGGNVVNLSDISGGGTSELDDLSDVQIGNPSVNTVLKYFGGQWVDGLITDPNVSDVSASKITGAFDDIEINGDLNHDGSKVGFYGVTPVTRREQAYNPSATLSNLHFTLNQVIYKLAQLGLLTISS